MLVGHYAVAYALRAKDQETNLSWYFLAVQGVDILFSAFVLLGIEQVRIVHGFTLSNDLDLSYIPFTHSFVASLMWGGVAFALFWLCFGRLKSAALIALAVLSHQWLDLAVHTPDLPIASESSAKFGFGLWNHPAVEIPLELALLAGGYWVYRKAAGATRARDGLFALLFLLAFNRFLLAPPPTPERLGISMLATYVVLGAAAFLTDRKTDSLR